MLREEKTVSRRGFVQGATTLLSAALATTVLPARQAQAQRYPSRTIKMIVPYPAGGGSDAIARPLAPWVGEKLAQQVIVLNYGGATGMIGTSLAARSPADGYTLLLGSVAEIAINPAVFSTMTYNPERDLTPVSLVATSPLVLVVNPSLPARNVNQFIDLAKKRPGEINYASSGAGSPHHIAGEWMKFLAKIDITHVPFKGGGPQLLSLLSGEVLSGFVALPIVSPHLQSGKLLALAVTSNRRSPAIPEIPTLDESGLKGLDVQQWYGVLTPAGTPPDIATNLNATFVAAAKDPKIRAGLLSLGAEALGTTSHQFAQFIHAEIAKFDKVVKQTKITI